MCLTLKILFPPIYLKRQKQKPFSTLVTPVSNDRAYRETQLMDWIFAFVKGITDLRKSNKGKSNFTGGKVTQNLYPIQNTGTAGRWAFIRSEPCSLYNGAVRNVYDRSGRQRRK